MFKKFIAMLTVLFYTYFLIGCTTTSYSRNKGGTVTSSPSVFKAKKYLEVLLTTDDLRTYKCKLVSLEGKEIIFLPSPYWNMDSIRIDLNKVQSIAFVEEKGSAAGDGFAIGFAIGFIGIGTIAGLASEYDEDYSAALGGAAIVGLAVGLIGLIGGALADAGKKTEYEINNMSDLEKIKTIQKIMGL